MELEIAFLLLLGDKQRTTSEEDEEERHSLDIENCGWVNCG